MGIVADAAEFLRLAQPPAVRRFRFASERTVNQRLVVVARSTCTYVARLSLSLSLIVLLFYCSLRSLRRNLHYFPTRVGRCAGYTMVAPVRFISALKSWIECSLRRTLRQIPVDSLPKERGKETLPLFSFI